MRGHTTDYLRVVPEQCLKGESSSTTASARISAAMQTCRAHCQPGVGAVPTMAPPLRSRGG
jgi:hypothetical protein